MSRPAARHSVFLSPLPLQVGGGGGAYVEEGGEKDSGGLGRVAVVCYLLAGRCLLLSFLLRTDCRPLWFVLVFH